MDLKDFQEVLFNFSIIDNNNCKDKNVCFKKAMDLILENVYTHHVSHQRNSIFPMVHSHSKMILPYLSLSEDTLRDSDLKASIKYSLWGVVKEYEQMNILPQQKYSMMIEKLIDIEYNSTLLLELDESFTYTLFPEYSYILNELPDIIRNIQMAEREKYKKKYNL